MRAPRTDCGGERIVSARMSGSVDVPHYAADAFCGVSVPWSSYTREWEKVMFTEISLGSEHGSLGSSCLQRLSADRTPAQEQSMLCNGLHQGFLQQSCAFAWVCRVCDAMAVLFA